ncbi:MAG: LIC12162 family protein [Desulfovibrio sp.]|nr:LIC12162 family protein [Desulfovibrio sp.]
MDERDILRQAEKDGATLVLGAMPDGASPKTHLAAGPWCFEGLDETFPDWDRNFVFAPEPLRAPELLDFAVDASCALAADSIPQIARKLCPRGASLPPCYWEVLLAPWAIDVAKQIVERCLRVRAMVAAWGALPLRVPLLPAECRFSFATEHDFTLHGALSTNFSHWLMSRLLEAEWPEAWQKIPLPAVNERHENAAATGLKARLRDWLRERHLALPFPRLKGLGTLQALRLSLALLHKSHGPDKTLSLAENFSRIAKGAQADLPIDALPVFMLCLPDSLRVLKHPDSVAKDALGPRLRAASVIAYEDTAYRQRLALWRARGNRLMFIQHGGNYGQVRRVCDTGFVEYSQHAFITWGWRRHEGERGNFIPLPYPQIARIADAWHGSPDSPLLYVGTEMPLHGYRLDAHPTPLQLVAYRRAKERFFEAIGEDIRAKAAYRPYFDVPGTLTDAPWLLPRFPSLRRSTGPLLPQLLSCRLLVMDHHGTTQLEAFAANVPSVLFWSREAWPLTKENEALIDRLADAGIWHASPEEAATHIRRIWPDPLSWWMSAPVQEARKAFCERNALTVACDETPYWIETLEKL